MKIDAQVIQKITEEEKLQLCELEAFFNYQQKRIVFWKTLAIGMTIAFGIVLYLV